jgi:hypothetical protein
MPDCSCRGCGKSHRADNKPCVGCATNLVREPQSNCDVAYHMAVQHLTYVKVEVSIYDESLPLCTQLNLN